MCTLKMFKVGSSLLTKADIKDNVCKKNLLFLQYANIKSAPYPGMAKLMFILFQVLIPILLLNMLIAMMGNTYGQVNEKSDKEFLKQVRLLEIVIGLLQPNHYSYGL